MPRPKLLRSNRLPYHVTARSNNREWFYLPVYRIWDIFSELLKELAEDFSVQIHAFVLMSNHFHMLVTTPGMDLDEAMHHFMREGARKINKEAGRINHIFGGPYKWSIISNSRYYEHAARYVYQNPVKANIVDRVEAYRFSSIHYLSRKLEMKFPISESIFERQSVMDLALWEKLDLLNTPYNEEQNDTIKRAIRHSVFSFHRNRMTGRIPPDLLLALESTKECRTKYKGREGG